MPPRRTQEERSATTRGKLLDATIDCLIDLGYRDTTTTVIAERAGVSRGAQLHHYPTKQDLVFAAVEHLSRRIGGELTAEAARLPEGDDRLSAAVELLWSRFSGPLFLAWLELLMASRTDDELRDRIRNVDPRLQGDVQERLHQVFGAEIAKQPGFGLALEATFDLLYGLAVQRVLAPGNLRGRKKREQVTLDAWKRILPTLLANGG
jgi:AcrR family transcriptional regulator